MAPQAPNNRLRVAGRLAIGFALDLVRLGGFGRDVVDGLLLAAISQANVAQITRNPDLQRQYARLDQPPPDELRRPVSVSAIANSLRVPFETARRRITALSELGIVKPSGRGVVIPTAPLDSPLYRFAAQAHYDLVRNLYRRLRGIGFYDDLARPTSADFDPDNPPTRLVVRLSTDFVLRLADPISLYVGDLVSALLLVDLICANTRDLSDDEGGRAEGWEPEDFVPDDARRPIRPAELSERLGIPIETVRRHLKRLIQADHCERTENGFLVPARVLAREPFVRFVLDNQSHLQRLFGQLAEFGVLSEWEREVVALRGAA